MPAELAPLQKTALATQNIGDTVSDYIDCYTRDILSLLRMKSSHDMNIGKAHVDNLIGALSWPGFSNMERHEVFADMKSKVDEMARVALLNFKDDKLEVVDPHVGLTYIVRERVFDVAKEARSRGYLGSRALRTLAAGNAVIALGNDNPWFKKAQRDLITEVGFLNSISHKRAKAPAP